MIFYLLHFRFKTLLTKGLWILRLFYTNNNSCNTIFDQYTLFDVHFSFDFFKISPKPQESNHYP